MFVKNNNLKNFTKKISDLIPSKFQNFLPTFLRKKEKKRYVPKVFTNYIDPTKTREEKIEEEKRRRHQGYTNLEYLLNLTTYFDFFSADSFKISQNAKHFSQIANRKTVTTDFVLFSFFSIESNVSEILKSNPITKEIIGKHLTFEYLESSQERRFPVFSFAQNFFRNLRSFVAAPVEEKFPDETIEYSMEVNLLFEKSAENAMKRFKTPVISTEILFITMMEETDSKAGTIIQSFLTDDTDWYLLRYKMMKRLYKQESYIRSEINKNQHYFAYLLKTQLTDFELQQLMNTNQLSIAVSIFRNELISEAVKVDIHKLIREDVVRSLKKKRYSTER